MRKLLSLLLACIMLATCIPLAACAETAPQYTSHQFQINWDHIKAVGKQDPDGQACACYALAYCRTLLDGQVHEWHEYSNTKDENKASAQWTPGKYSKYRNKDKAATFRKLYEELCNGNPTVAQVKKINKSNTHYVTVVGFEGVTDLDSLSEKNFLILDPGTSTHKIYNMSEKYELRKNPDDSYYRLYTDTSSATAAFDAVPSAPVEPEEPPVVDDGKWPTPTDLRWGYLHDAILNENEVVEGWQFVPGRPTDIAFRSEADGWHSVTLYKENGDNDAYINSEYAYGNDGYYSSHRVAGVPDLETGDYYFAVYCAGSSGYEDSEIATSDIWHYTRPDAQIGVCTNLSWNGTAISYVDPDNADRAYACDVNWFYGETADTEPTGAGGLSNYIFAYNEDPVDLSSSYNYMDKKAGYYYYQVRLISDDVTQIRNSEWSPMSEAIYFDGTNVEIRPGYNPGTTPEVPPEEPPVVEDGKLSTATDLKWGYTVEYINNDVKQVPGRTSDVSWNITPNNHGNMYSVEVFQEKGDNDVRVGNWGGSYSSNAAHQYGGDSFAVGTLELETGDYYYVVTNIDTTGAKDLSDPAVSGLWHYTKPDLRVGICTDLTWDWPYANYAAPAGDPNVDGYAIEWYYSETEGGELEYVTAMYTYSPDFTSCDLIQHMTSRFGNGYYYFKVKALSRDISIACNSNWSELSGACYFDGTTGTPVVPEAPHTHTFGDWSVTTAATCTAEGSRTRSCECGETETETIPAVGHTEVIDAAVAATCTADGKTEGKHCSVCAQVLTAQEAIPATGHDTQGDTEFVWSEDHSACTLEVGCTACGQKQSVACIVTSEVVNGSIVYRACVDFNGMSFSDAQQGGAAEAPALWGDVSGDGWIDSFDASLIMKYDVMLIGDADMDLASADVSGDGYVDSYDASLILKYDVMLIDKFPVEG